MTPAAIRVLIADDHAIVRCSVRRLLESRPEICVVAEAADGEEAVVKIDQTAPDLALVDLVMPKGDGISVIRHVVRSNSRTRIIAFTAHEDPRRVRDALVCGAAGFLPKSSVAADLFEAIATVTAGKRYVHTRIMDVVVGMRTGVPFAGAADLSERENEVLRLVALGYANKEIAARLLVSVKTVETYKARAMQKLDAHSRVDIVRIGVERGWLGRGQNPAVETESRSA